MDNIFGSSGVPTSPSSSPSPPASIRVSFAGTSFCTENFAQQLSSAKREHAWEGQPYGASLLMLLLNYSAGLKQGDMLRLMKAAGNTASSRSSVSERATVGTAIFLHM
jgi:hypothetical protein